MKRIAVITATRAEYGLLFPLIKELRKYENSKFVVELIVTGTHLTEEYGKTKENIINDGIRIDQEIHIPVKSDSRLDIANNQAETLRKLAQLFNDIQYDAVVILGDRYEMLMVAVAATDMHIPIIHLYGGDTTEGAMDECIRHSITKMSYLHFATNEESRRRIIQMGENPKRVFNYGATGTDNILKSEKLTKKEALASVGLPYDCKYAVCTYHPVTLEEGNIELLIMNFLKALSYFDDVQFIITKSNADQGGMLINRVLEREAGNFSNIHIFSSLGRKRYLSLIKYSEAVIGNSSSGIMEAPVFHIPTVNIGDRQKGRSQSESIINCDTDVHSIVEAIKYALSDEMKMLCCHVQNPYGDGSASPKIAKKIMETLQTGMKLKKEFYNIEIND